MIPEITDEVLRFMLFLFLSVRLFYDTIFRIIRFMVGGGAK